MSLGTKPINKKSFINYFRLLTQMLSIPTLLRPKSTKVLPPQDLSRRDLNYKIATISDVFEDMEIPLQLINELERLTGYRPPSKAVGLK